MSNTNQTDAQSTLTVKFKRAEMGDLSNVTEFGARAVFSGLVATITCPAGMVDAVEDLLEADDNVESYEDGADAYVYTRDDGVVVAVARATDEQISALSDAAGAAGDTAQVALCGSALEGIDSARRECSIAIWDAST